MAADEESFLTLLIASERMEKWLAVIRDGGRGALLKQAVTDLAAAVQQEAYAEEARRGGAVTLLTQLLKRTEDDELLAAISDALAICSGLMASSGKVRTFSYGGTPVVLKEGALGDGVGAKVWTVAHTFCREMAMHPGIVRGKQVLEIGSGCGACGILASKLGAERVLLTDYVDAVLCNLKDCMHLNGNAGKAGSSTGSSSDTAAGPIGLPEAAGAVDAREEQSEDWDFHDASKCGNENLSVLLCGAVGSNRKQQQTAEVWDAPPMHVRFYDWQDSVDQLGKQERAQLAAIPGVAEGVAAAAVPGATIDIASNQSGVPALGAEERFDVIIGTDILYEWPMVEMVPAVLKHRLLPGGRALLCCAIREQTMFDAFTSALTVLNLRSAILSVQPCADDAGLLDIRQEYEGGYVLIAVEHAQAPTLHWHPPELFSGDV